MLAEKSMSCASILHFSWLKVWAMPPLLHAPSLIKVQGEISVYFLNILWWSFVVFLVLGTFLFFFFFRKSLGMILLWCYSWKSMGGLLYWVGVYFREIEVDFRVWSQECPQSTLLPIPSSGLFQSHCRLDPKFLPLLSFLVFFPQVFHHNLISFTVFILSSLSSQAKWQILLISLSLHHLLSWMPWHLQEETWLRFGL